MTAPHAQCQPGNAPDPDDIAEALEIVRQAREVYEADQPMDEAWSEMESAYVTLIVRAFEKRAAPAQCGVLTHEVDFEYTNWEGRKSLRRARPISIRFGKSEWHPKPQWLMRAFDIDKGEEREFAMADMEFEESGLAALAVSSAHSRSET
jgi:hypothetical protein